MMTKRLNKAVSRVVAVGCLIALFAAELIATRGALKIPPLWLELSCLFYIPIILLASHGYGVLGAFSVSTLSMTFATLVHMRARLPNPLGCILMYALSAIVLYIYFVLEQREVVKKRIVYNDLDAQWNEVSKEYSRHTGLVKSCKNKIVRYSTLRQLGEKLISTLSLNETSKKMLELSRDVVGKGDLSSLFFLDDNLKSFTLAHQIQLTEASKRIAADPGDAFNTWIIRNRQNLIVEDLRSDFRFEENAKGKPTLSLIAVPLITENKLIGAVRIESTASKAFQLEDLRILATLAHVASSSLKNARLYAETLELSMKDGLTGLYVPTHFHHEFQKAFLHARQNAQTLSVFMADIDNFKMVNDRFGHTVGDTVLKKISEIFRYDIDSAYVPTRYGGEEFSAFFPNWDLEKVATLAESLRKKVSEIPFEIRREPLQITLSIGVCQLKEEDMTKEQLLFRTDLALYQAKRSGKNKVCVG